LVSLSLTAHQTGNIIRRSGAYALVRSLTNRKSQPRAQFFVTSPITNRGGKGRR